MNTNLNSKIIIFRLVCGLTDEQKRLEIKHFDNKELYNEFLSNGNFCWTRVTKTSYIEPMTENRELTYNDVNTNISTISDNNNVKIFRYLPENDKIEILAFNTYNELNTFMDKFTSRKKELQNDCNMYSNIRSTVINHLSKNTSHDIIITETKKRIEELIIDWIPVNLVVIEEILDK